MTMAEEVVKDRDKPQTPKEQPTSKKAAPTVQAPQSKSQHQATPQPQPAPQTIVVQQKKSSDKKGWLFCCGCGCIPLLVFSFFGFLLFLLGMLSLVGAKGQPGTIVPPTSVKTPINLKAVAGDSEIKLTWSEAKGSIKEYQVFRSLTGKNDFSEIGSVDSPTTAYTDSDVKKGKTYYYYILALSSAGAKSGNSNVASASIQQPPIVPKGIFSWKDVLAKYNADTEYAKLFDLVTGKTRSDIEYYVKLEDQGKNMKLTLLKGTVILNTSEDYKLLPNYVLVIDRVALTDETGVPHVLTWCGNPMKLIVKVTPASVFIQNIQIFITNVINVFPVYITNIFIYAGRPVSSVVVNIIPRDVLGPTVIYVSDLPEAEVSGGVEEEEPEEEEVEKPEEPGGQWVVPGKILVIADPADPGPEEDVMMTVRLIPAKEGVEISYTVNGTDGYYDEGTSDSDDAGEINFYIPGGEGGVVDTITVDVPSLNLDGSTQYTF